MDSLKIGNITLPHRAVFGPMAGFTDAPCRRLMAQHGAGFTVSEMVSSRALVYHDHKTVSLLKAEPNGAPYGVQIFGEVPQIMGEAAAAIEEYQFDFLDINMGCPAPKIVSGGAGSKLMLDPDLCGRIVEQVKAHTTRPVTVKMRKGWDADHITAVECAKACEQAGAELIAVHARTREQMYTPGIDPDIIAKVKDAGVPVICCGEPMSEIIPGTTDAAVEKHVPVWTVENGIVHVKVGSVEHPMLPEHYIEWVSLQTKQGNQRKELHPGEKPEVCFALCEGDEVEAVYAYCNLHSLWKA